ncbi:MAG: hypothetical protein ABSA57_20350 [Candidatus Acidiferrales bacterium]|jgi:hypothetical protein
MKSKQPSRDAECDNQSNRNWVLRFKLLEGLMGNQGSLLKKTSNAIGGVFLSLLLGIVGGSVCGAAILVFGGLIGRSGSTGEEYLGFWDVATIWLGLIYGGFFYGGPQGQDHFSAVIS